MNEAKFQYSQSDGNGGILVARSDDMEEIVRFKRWADELTGKSPKVIVQTPTITASAHPAGLWCNKHNTAMRLNKNGKPYHMDRTRPEGDMFCNGRGYPSEFAGQSSEEIGKKLNAEDYSL